MKTTPVAPATLDDLRVVLLETGRILPSARLTALTGGVSSIVARVDDDCAEPWVVKAPLARLAVADEWVVDRRRGASEAAALDLLQGRVGPVVVPRLLFFDAQSTIMGQEMIPGPPPTYKDQLLGGEARPDVPAALGAAAGALHRMAPPDILATRETWRLFDELRLDPYYRATAARRPELRPALSALIDETVASAPRQLVHGDLTPKNVLVLSDQAVLVDWEVAHAGDASFDLATLTAHLLLKSLRSAETEVNAPPLDSSRRFWDAYDGPADRVRALRHTGAVMLARLFGKSPVEYLPSEAERATVYDVARLALDGQFTDINELVAAAESANERGR
jgi:5-methylthioribose kinase